MSANWLEAPLDEGHPCDEWRKAQGFWAAQSKTEQKCTAFCNGDKAPVYLEKL